jgi:hypothetical protein
MVTRFMILVVVKATITAALAQQVKTAGIATHEVTPTVSQLTISSSTVTDLHLKPLFTTTIRLPEPVTSVAVGAPTLFEVEHSDEEPHLVFVKPTSKSAVTSNLVIALQSGQEISMRLLSDGSEGTTTPVDFIVNYQPRQSFLIGSTDAVTAVPTGTTPTSAPGKKVPSLIDQVIEDQSNIATPAWVPGLNKGAKNPDHKTPGKPMLAALGDVRQHGPDTLVAYSVLNTTDHWIEVLPPQIELNSPNIDTDRKKDKKKHEILAEQVPIEDFRLSGRRLAPGERADGAVEFNRPGFKQSKDRLLLQLATASEVDDPVLLQIPFVAPGR